MTGHTWWTVQEEMWESTGFNEFLNCGLARFMRRIIAQELEEDLPTSTGDILVRDNLVQVSRTIFLHPVVSSRPLHTMLPVHAFRAVWLSSRAPS